mgnify:CR=1 FL=1
MIICPRCHAMTRPIGVHGHIQCEICKSNIDDCCQGEVCQPTMINQEEDKERPPTSP